MSKSNDTERTRELTEAELDAVSGGFEPHEHTTITQADSAQRKDPYRGFSFRIDVSGIDRGGFRS
jgi:hypothetical protein